MIHWNIIALSIFVSVYGILTGINLWKALERREKEKELEKKI